MILLNLIFYVDILNTKFETDIGQSLGIFS